MGKYLYRASLGELGEDEIDSVFLFCPDEPLISTLAPNPLEVEELRWISPEDLDRMLDDSPEKFSHWFPGTYRLIRAALAETQNM